jgi:hypothetical protein
MGASIRAESDREMAFEALGPHTGLPPIRVGTHAHGGSFRVWEWFDRATRAKWLDLWKDKDKSDPRKLKYSKAEVNLRQCLKELEVREAQLRKAIVFLTPEELETLCPKQGL